MMKILAQTISFVFHPLLMVTYGIIMALAFTYLSLYPYLTKLFILGGVFFCTAVMPGFFILLLIKTGNASDVELTNHKERTLPYLLFIFSIMACIFFLFKMTLPVWLTLMLIGAVIALIIALCINFFWKISAHMIGIGGLLGAVMGVARIQLMNPYGAFIVLFIIAGLLGMARISLQKHTPMQVYAGFVLGLICTYMASSWNIIYLFIK